MTEIDNHWTQRIEDWAVVAKGMHLLSEKAGNDYQLLKRLAQKYEFADALPIKDQLLELHHNIDSIRLWYLGLDVIDRGALTLRFIRGKSAANTLLIILDKWKNTAQRNLESAKLSASL